MNKLYYLYLLTFFGFPIFGLAFAKVLSYKDCKKYLAFFLVLFLIHNVFFIGGVSLSGDYSDYVVFSLEFLFLSIVVPLLHYSSNSIPKVIRSIGTIVLIAGFVQTVIGFVVMPVLVQDYSVDKVYSFNSSKKMYQVRRYSFGSATLIDTRYTFKTYQNYKLPFEKLINKTSFFEMKEKVNFNDGDFKIEIKQELGKQVLEFSSPNRKIDVLFD